MNNFERKGRIKNPRHQEFVSAMPYPLKSFERLENNWIWVIGYHWTLPKDMPTSAPLALGFGLGLVGKRLLATLCPRGHKQTGAENMATPSYPQGNQSKDGAKTNLMAANQ
jgi:hypothetical protein